MPFHTIAVLAVGLHAAVAVPTPAQPASPMAPRRADAAVSDSFRPHKPRLDTKTGALMGAAFGGILLFAIATTPNDFDLDLKTSALFVAVPTAVGATIGTLAPSPSMERGRARGAVLRVRF
jgi:hypothetical protein